MASWRQFVFWYFVINMTQLLSPDVSEEFLSDAHFLLYDSGIIRASARLQPLLPHSLGKQPALCVLSPPTLLLIARTWVLVFLLANF